MGRGGIASVFLGSLLLGAIAGFFLGRIGVGKEGAVDSPKQADDGGAARIAALEARIADLIEEKGEREEALKALAAKLEDPEKEAEAKAEPEAAKPAAGASTIQLASVDEADAAFEDALRRYDLDGILALGAALLAMREEGYDKMIALMDRITPEIEKDRTLARLLNNELYAGRFLRAFADHREDVLRFALHLVGKDPEGLGPASKELQQELGSELGIILLGYSEDADPDIQEGFLDFFRKEMESRGIRGRSINAIAQVKGDAATDFLIGLCEKADGSQVEALAGALWYRKDPRALAALRSLRGRVGSPEVGAYLDAAIRSME